MGSLSELHTVITDAESAYIMGLWCADGYYWSSSVGITNVDKRLVMRFASFLRRFFPRERIKLRIYYPLGQRPIEKRTAYRMRLAKQIAYQLYVNSRPLLRLFRQTENTLSTLSRKYVFSYFAGRFDGDGSIAHDLRRDMRITYGNKAEAVIDQQLLHKCGYETNVYHYKGARTYVLYIPPRSAQTLLRSIQPRSLKVQSLLPRRDLFRRG